ELGYTLEDLPHPRGQILVKTDMTVPGYFNDPEATREAFTEDGFWRSGDIGEMLPNGQLRIVDRVKSIFKLSQGEYVAPEPLEHLFCQSPLVLNCFVYGQFDWDHLLAVAVPQTATLLAHPQCPLDSSSSSSSSFPFFAPWVAELILQDIRRLAVEAGLPSFKAPAALLIDAQPFSFERGFVTASMKLKRVELIRHYQQQLVDLHLSLISPSFSSSSLGLAEELALLIDRCHGTSGADQTRHYQQLDHLLRGRALLATDSLQTMQVLLHLRARYHVDISFQHFFQADAITLCQLLTTSSSDISTLSLMDSQLTADWCDSESSSFEPELDQKLDQKLDQELDLQELEAWDVLITGGNGAIGSHLTWQLLKERANKPSAPGPRIICIVRAATDALAFERIKASLRALNPQDSPQLGLLLPALTVYAGDVAEPRLGLPAEVYQQLQASVGRVYHLAAQVNWNLPYSLLRAANVQGTLSVLDFCRGTPQHLLLYVSTVSVAESLQIAGPSRRSLAAVQTMDGYSQSKLIGERYLFKAIHSSSSFVNAVVFRPAMITGNSSSGLSNPTDLVPRFLKGITELRCYPAGTSRRQDMLPADLAASILIRASPLRRGQVVAIADPEGISFDDIGVHASDFLASRSLPPLEPLPYPAFRSRLLASPSNPLFPFLASLFSEHQFQAGLPEPLRFSFSSSSYQSLLHSHPPPPHRQLIQSYLAWSINHDARSTSTVQP
ncbi:MAG: SDR family oxidoreductase, partial [archaeon]|nr:SDR family oxidoreductase [archaeon]